MAKKSFPFSILILIIPTIILGGCYVPPEVTDDQVREYATLSAILALVVVAGIASAVASIIGANRILESGDEEAVQFWKHALYITVPVSVAAVPITVAGSIFLNAIW